VNIRPAIFCALGSVVAATLAGCPPERIDPNVPEREPPTFDGGAPDSPFAPQFGSTVTRDEAPPPISGGTMARSDDDYLVVADPDRDTITVVDISTNRSALPLSSRERIVGTLDLAPHSEPGRVVIGSDGEAYVALRHAGAIVTVGLADARAIETRTVCPAPRGMAFDGDQLLVACVDGDLLSLPAHGGAATVAYHDIQGDLRDVVVVDQLLYVTRFRTANVIVLDKADHHVVREFGPGQFTHTQGRFAGALFQPSVAWRTVAGPGGRVGMVHQRSLLTAPGNAPVDTASSGGYGSPVTSPVDCGNSIVHSTVSFMSADQASPDTAGEIPLAVLPVDMAVSADGASFVIVAAGNNMSPGAPRAFRLFRSTSDVRPQGDCEPGVPIAVDGQPTAVVLDAHGSAIVQSREPARLVFESGDALTLSTSSRFDTGHAVFHANSGGGLACAGCHPEGGDDARVWVFDREGLRRTQNLRGGLLGTEPFHWGGDQANFNHLANDVFVGRMSGSQLTDPQIDALARWVDRIPVMPTRAAATMAAPELDAIARGRALFTSSDVGCVNCHSGAKYSNNLTVSVGTGPALQVPTLVGVRWRAPYMHTGCAATLRDRFTHPECGGGDLHGHTSQLSDAQIDDLVAYLQSL
jgi:mono/diheme cytochrome c family protein/DNA-binding beta-propeller fold protein YncE